MGGRLILVDTSAWVEYLRDTDDDVVQRLQNLIQDDTVLAITEPIEMELLAGATTPRREHDISRLVHGLSLLPVDAAVDYRAAARISGESRRNGHPIRSLVDCLIAAVALRRDVALLHRDRDFAFIHEITALRVC